MDSYGADGGPAARRVLMQKLQALTQDDLLRLSPPTWVKLLDIIPDGTHQEWLSAMFLPDLLQRMFEAENKCCAQTQAAVEAITARDAADEARRTAQEQCLGALTINAQVLQTLDAERVNLARMTAAVASSTNMGVGWAATMDTVPERGRDSKAESIECGIRLENKLEFSVRLSWLENVRACGRHDIIIMTFRPVSRRLCRT